VSAGDEGHGGVEMGARHGIEDQDQRNERGTGGDCVLQQLEADTVG